MCYDALEVSVILFQEAMKERQNRITERDVGLATPEGERKRQRWKKQSFESPILLKPQKLMQIKILSKQRTVSRLALWGA